MVLISHRGNLSGKIPRNENHPDYIDKAIYAGYNVEIDVWVVEGVILLGHDEPQYGISQLWLNQRVDKLWIHCKNIEAMEWFNSIGGFNYFWHENDVMTLTSNGRMWVYPGKQPIKGSIAVLPEVYNDDISKCYGVCSDYIEKYKK
jgi:hypothetical protein